MPDTSAETPAAAPAAAESTGAPATATEPPPGQYDSLVIILEFLKCLNNI